MITSKTIGNGILRAVGILAAIYILLMFLFKIQSVLIYLFIALIVTMIFSPVVFFLKNRLKFPHIAAVIVTVLLFIGVVAGFIMMFVPLIISQGNNLSLLDTAQMERDITMLMDQIDSYLAHYNINSKQLIKESNITSSLNFNFIPMIVNAVLGALSGFGVGFGSVLFITFFFLKDRNLFEKNARRLLPEAHEDKILNSLRKINYMLSRYFIGLIMQISVLFIIYLTTLLIFGVENAFIIAFITALLNIIPYIGPLIATLLAVLLTLLGNIGPETQDHMFSTTLYVAIGYCLAQIIDNNITGPLIFSNSVNSHPLEIFVVILASGFVFGMLGMIIAIPLYTSIKVVVKEFFPRNPFVRVITKGL